MDVLEHTRRGGVARFLERIQPENGDEARLDEFKEALWSTVVKFGEHVLIGIGLDEKARKELLEKVISLREPKRKTRADACKDSSTVNKKN